MIRVFIVNPNSLILYHHSVNKRSKINEFCKKHNLDYRLILMCPKSGNTPMANNNDLAEGAGLMGHSILHLVNKTTTDSNRGEVSQIK